MTVVPFTLPMARAFQDVFDLGRDRNQNLRARAVLRLSPVRLDSGVADLNRTLIRTPLSARAFWVARFVHGGHRQRSFEHPAPLSGDSQHNKRNVAS
jgi:hypothetical protein